MITGGDNPSSSNQEVNFGVPFLLMVRSYHSTTSAFKQPDEQNGMEVGFSLVIRLFLMNGKSCFLFWEMWCYKSGYYSL